MCIEDNVPVTSGWMTTIDEQKAAEANNWETLVEISAEELAKKSGLDFGNNVKSFKMMYISK